MPSVHQICECYTLANLSTNNVFDIPSSNSSTTREKLEHVSNLAKANTLKLNTNKTKEMIFHRPRVSSSSFPRPLDGITRVINMKVLGVIKRNLHLADNSTLTDENKLYKVRSYIDLLNRKFCKFGVFAHNLSIDEQMIPYFDHHSCKMFMKVKPVRFGFKAWCLCSSDGFLFNAIPHAGREDYVDPDLGLGATVVLQLLGVVDEPHVQSVYFDNFFTSHRLLQKLTEKKFCATGTIREPRLLSCTFENSKLLAKQNADHSTSVKIRPIISLL